MDVWEESRRTLQACGLGPDLTYEKTIHSSVTDAWGVQWNEQEIGRDLLQNFYDANKDDPASITVAVETMRSRVTITAPAPFNLERLFYLGSEKGDEDVGQYGEGFKAAAMCLLRDHGVHPIGVSGNRAVFLRFAATPVASTQLRPIEYDFFTSPHALCAGSALILHGCKQKRLVAALEAGITHFFYEGNPLLQRLLWEDWHKKFAMYAAAVQNGPGYIFYRNLMRGQIPDLPLVLVIKKRYQDLDKLVQKDRDRTAFGGVTLEKCYALFAQHALKGNVMGQRIVLEAAQHYWVRGHPLLSAMAHCNRHYSPWTAPMTAEVFGDRYYAESPHPPDAGLLLEYQAIEEGWKKEGRQRLPQYFAAFGVITAVKRRAEQQRHIVAENQRTPTSGEDGAIACLSRLLEDLAPSVAGVFKTRRVSYVVARDDVIAGQLRSGRGYRSQTVFLEEGAFEQDFAPAVALFLHEHSHIFGWDGSRGFTDELTHLLETVIRWRRQLDPYEAQWNRAREAVLAERQYVLRTEAEQIDDLLQEKTAHDLRALLKKLSPAQVRALIEAP